MNNSNFFLKEYLSQTTERFKRFFKSTKLCAIIFSLLMLVPFILSAFTNSNGVEFNSFSALIMVTYLVMSGLLDVVTTMDQIRFFDENKTIFKNLSDTYLILLINMLIYISIEASFAILRYFSANNYSQFIACCLLIAILMASWFFQMTIVSDFVEFQWSERREAEEILEKFNE